MDPYACHSLNFSILARAIGEQYGLPTGQMNNLPLAAFIHDLGRLTIPGEWTSRKDRLTPQEMEVVRQHGNWGLILLLSREEFTPQVGVLAAEHHRDLGVPTEKGSYTPDIIHKIVALADRYDLALKSPQHYWNRYRQDRLLKQIINHRGVDYDPLIVKLLVNCVGYYPVGTMVQIEDGRRGIVVRPSQVNPPAPGSTCSKKNRRLP